MPPTEYLPQKVALIIGISGACRCDELLKMKISDLDILENRIIITYFSNIISKYRWRHPTVEKVGGWKSNTVAGRICGEFITWTNKNC
ncbi:hypothetical protein NQ317_011368 [Molorchus minor]|uniref:Tyr recombinase domain-containing protein n=1 Tax=Molorchus minor TaxID=1323400 RepID=A0ABQ9JD84_9CUCU|nr:hypothetical protein NQ317_011368 [Molorchus minor]